MTSRLGILVLAALSGSAALATAVRAEAGHLAQPAVAKETTIYVFRDTPDGAVPPGSLVANAAGDLTGVTLSGGANKLGAVFRLIPSGSTYKEEILYSFKGGKDGVEPNAPLLSRNGVFFGTTQIGGSTQDYGCGTVFRLSPHQGAYVETVIFRFDCAKRGGRPYSGVIADASGNLYGTASVGGAGKNGTGVVYELSPQNGTYVETILYSFVGSGSGFSPKAGLVMDASGNLYGTTPVGGDAGDGIVFKLTKTASGYTQSIIHTFGVGNAHDGRGSASALVVDSSGALYGTTPSGGSDLEGVAFKLTPSGSQYDEKIIHQFGFSTGQVPSGSLLPDANGDFYGLTGEGGSKNAGVMYELTPHGTSYRYHPLYDFQAGSDGASPGGTLVQDPSGAFFGATYGGRGQPYGNVFKIALSFQ